MQPIYIEGTFDTPTVKLDKDKGEFEISGRSLPENTFTFYKPIISWLEEYRKQPNERTALHIKLEYFNTASSKALLDVFTRLEGLPNTVIRWHYMYDDADMEEAGLEYAELIDVPFEFIQINEPVSNK